MSTTGKNFYITTTLPYVNADPHIGFALELIQADVIARFHRARGEEVVFNTGTDEHGKKIYQRALEEGKDPQAYVDEYARKFEELTGLLGTSVTDFIRTSNPRHKRAAQAFWKRCADKGDIYKKNYAIKYCVGCELEKTESELENGRCPLHPKTELELVQEENYFFKFSKYEKSLLDFYRGRPDFVIPDFRFNEIKKFVETGLQDFSVSRLKEKMPWGVGVPDDPDQVMYVWFDALINYISTLGWPEDEQKFSAFWPGLQVAGKDNLRQQSAMWQAMLMSAGLPNSKQIFIHGFITVGGQKMSKSVGNVVSPFDLVQKYGVDPVRYYLLREIPSGEDGDFSYEKFEERYNGDLANGIGNLVARVAALGEKISPISLPSEKDIKMIEKNWETENAQYDLHMQFFRFNQALEIIWRIISQADKDINDDKPWKLSDEEKKYPLAKYAYTIHKIGALLDPFLPETAQKIREHIAIGDKDIAIKKGENLFPRR